MKKYIFIAIILVIGLISLGSEARAYNRGSIVDFFNVCDRPQPVTRITRATSSILDSLGLWRSQAVPFGFWGLNGYQCQLGYQYVQNNFKASVYQLASEGPNYNLDTLLPQAERAGMKVSLRITGGYEDFKDSDNNFNIDLFNNDLDNYFSNPNTATETQEYVDSGTLIGIMILDDIYNYSGDDPTAEELEEMACEVEEHLDVMTWVREDLAYLELEDENFEFECLDAVGLQYSSTKGSYEDWIEEQYDLADDLNLDIILGLNIGDGGDGSSGQAGTRSGSFYVMSPEEITEYGEYLFDYAKSRPELELRMFLMWEYDAQAEFTDGTNIANYFNQTDYKSAISGLGRKALMHNFRTAPF